MGFALAQAVWQGEATTVLVTRIEGRSVEALRGLLRAVVKSAYDAGVYEVALHLDPERKELEEALKAEGFALGPWSSRSGSWEAGERGARPGAS